MAKALAASEQEAYCARREAMVYPWNMPAMTSAPMARATTVSIRVKAAEPFLTRAGWLVRMLLPILFVFVGILFKNPVDKALYGPCQAC
jgi:hypothetical protein